MLPDLRFALGAVLATVVLGIAALGLVSAVRLAQEARTVTLDTTRPLAYTAPAPAADRAQQPGGPFANVPVAQAPAVPAAPAEPAAAETPDDHATVDERAVVDPPLSPEGEPLPSEPASAPAAAVAIEPPSMAEPQPATEPQTVAEPPAATEPATVEHTGSIPDAPTADEAAPLPAKSKPAAKPKAKPKRTVQKRAAPNRAAKPRPRAQPGDMIPPTASTGYPVERNPRPGGGFQFGN